MEEQRAIQAGWAEITKSEYFELLGAEHLGQLTVVDDRGTIAQPVNFVVDHHGGVPRRGSTGSCDRVVAGERHVVCWSGRVGEAADPVPGGDDVGGPGPAGLDFQLPAAGAAPVLST